MWALTIIPPAWRAHGDEVIWFSAFVGAVSLIFYTAWKVFGKRFARWLNATIVAAIKTIVHEVIIPIMEVNDRYYQERILSLEDRMEEVESNGRSG